MIKCHLIEQRGEKRGEERRGEHQSACVGKLASCFVLFCVVLLHNYLPISQSDDSFIGVIFIRGYELYEQSHLTCSIYMA